MNNNNNINITNININNNLFVFCLLGLLFQVRQSLEIAAVDVDF